MSEAPHKIPVPLSALRGIRQVCLLAHEHQEEHVVEHTCTLLYICLCPLMVHAHIYMNYPHTTCPHPFMVHTCPHVAIYIHTSKSIHSVRVYMQHTHIPHVYTYSAHVCPHVTIHPHTTCPYLHMLHTCPHVATHIHSLYPLTTHTSYPHAHTFTCPRTLSCYTCTQPTSAHMITKDMHMCAHMSTDTHSGTHPPAPCWLV